MIKGLAINQLIKYLTAGLVFLLPLWFLPSFADFFLLPKSFLAMVIASLMLIAYIVVVVKEKKISLNIRPLHWPVALILVSFLLSTLVQSPNQVEAWVSRGIMLVTVGIIYFVASNWLRMKDLEFLKWALVVSTTILSLVAIYQVLGITESVSEQFSWLGNKLWNPTGSPTSLVLFTLTGAAMSLNMALKRHNEIVKTGVLFFMVLVQMVAAASVVSELLPGKENSLVHLPYAYGYSIAIDTLKNWQTALLGVGPENFLSAFTRFKPAGYNSLDSLWNVRFSTSSSELLQVMTTTGLVGLIAWTWLFVYLIRSAVRIVKVHPDWSVSIFLAILFMLLFPNNVTTLGWLFVIVMVTAVLNEKSKEVVLGKAGASIVSVVFVLFILTGYYYSFWYSSAEVYFRRALSALQKNQGVEVYNSQIATIRANPYRVSYRIAYSRTNLALATSLAGQQELGEEDSQRIVQLIQQGVREARAAVQLNPQNVIAWENLANTYRQLLNFANNANEFASQSYSQALILDPRNPRLWVDYGGLLMSTGQVDAATQAFRQAVALKSNYANAHFNLANAFRAEGKYAQAFQQMQRVQSLVDPSSQDYLTASNAVEELKKLIEQSNDQPISPPVNELEGLEESEQTLTTPPPVPEKPESLDAIDLTEQPDLSDDEDQNADPVTTPTPTGQLTPIPTITASPTP